ncbi:NAD(P)-binding domain-containing protein [Actinophytocola sp.]|uniref:NAD(P)-binding domain-containing protein n=1 Tax=Actinophytocola sp. TaxID=1872138 RepID=UPI00389AC41A
MRIIRRTPATVGVVGLGRTGLPLALALARSGLLVTGLDTDRSKVTALRRGESHLADDLHAVADWFEPTTDPSLLTGLDAYVITTHAAVDTVAPLITKGTLVVLQPDADAVHRLGAGSGLRPGADFHLTTAPDLVTATMSALSLHALTPLAA